MDSDSDTEGRSSSSSSCSDVDSEEFFEEFNEFGIRPYQFEPQLEVNNEDTDDEDEEFDEENDEENDEESRLTNSEWCQCGDHCTIMDREAECICCQEINAMINTCTSLPNDGGAYANQPAPSCITQHPGFASVCLNKWVLKTAWFQYKQQYEDAYEGPEHKQYRHIAYRQLARWCWGFLGKDVRVVLPSCAVMCIRAHFPPPGLEEDFEFEGFHYYS